MGQGWGMVWVCGRSAELAEPEREGRFQVAAAAKVPQARSVHCRVAWAPVDILHQGDSPIVCLFPFSGISPARRSL